MAPAGAGLLRTQHDEEPSPMQTIKLSFIGDNIRSSSAPKVHHMAAAQIGIDLSYELIVPAEKGFDFDWAFDAFSIFTGFDVTDKMALRDVLFRTLCCKGSS